MAQLRDRVVYTPRGAMPEAALNVLSVVYAFALEKYQQSKEPAHPAAPNEAKGSKDARPATQNYTG
jgi:hypothetical protein